MLYKLKPNQEPFQCCGGPFEGRKYLPGQIYTEIPPEEADKFEDVTETSSAQGTSRKAPAKNLEPRTLNIEQAATPPREE
jgi:hypothetical protein